MLLTTLQCNLLDLARLALANRHRRDYLPFDLCAFRSLLDLQWQVHLPVRKCRRLPEQDPPPRGSGLVNGSLQDLRFVMTEIRTLRRD